MEEGQCDFCWNRAIFIIENSHGCKFWFCAEDAECVEQVLARPDCSGCGE